MNYIRGKHTPLLNMEPGLQEKLPSTYADGWWINSTSAVEPRQNATAYCGKWMIFRTTGAPVDDAWRIINEATKTGRLGFASKVSTMKDKDSFYKDRDGNRSHVICCYTYDYTDEDDVFRVRKALRELGFTERLPYKSDKQTYANQYAHNSTGRVSLWYQ